MPLGIDDADRAVMPIVSLTACSAAGGGFSHIGAQDIGAGLYPWISI